ncbi:hypothetical protein K437DRAFT_256236 [Tilletiaria anomala UBC 951]|uniref:Uncharacterized protein n=1 Tax=Tilletiaria anomala (strain ATCC 24038 / CBS 436.72 / UBC 951) TaxID=1037660 RepID=A0A066W5C5_TILAU|nr:uncharacterized protein K437DRAFT_256236 [Tilletiaria anomala UBC 951]KDN46274.1 hypothetical protein K437DRAFT_256236 [Tilletiaria anomala UBC 951]
MIRLRKHITGLTGAFLSHPASPILWQQFSFAPNLSPKAFLLLLSLSIHPSIHPFLHAFIARRYENGLSHIFAARTTSKGAKHTQVQFISTFQTYGLGEVRTRDGG